MGPHGSSDARHVAAAQVVRVELGEVRESEARHGGLAAGFAQIVASAGQPGRITIATNMAGRGTDMKLGAQVADAGGLHVLATERHESRRIDRQIYGRAGRQGDPGSAQAFISVEDEILARFAPAGLREKAQQAVRRGLPGAKRLVGTAVACAQRSAQRQAFRQRRQVLEVDTWLAGALSFAGGGEG